LLQLSFNISTKVWTKSASRRYLDLPLKTAPRLAQNLLLGLFQNIYKILLQSSFKGCFKYIKEVLQEFLQCLVKLSPRAALKTLLQNADSR